MNKLFLITFLLISTICYSQFNLDSTQARKTIKIKEQRDSLLIVTDYFQTENDSLKSGIKIRDSKINAKQNIIDMQDTIIMYKDKQINKLENTPIIKEVVRTKWYTWAGVIISSVCAGLITGIFIK